jgi:DNA-binding beta-propeller fold protein YncE
MYKQLSLLALTTVLAVAAACGSSTNKGATGGSSTSGAGAASTASSSSGLSTSGGTGGGSGVVLEPDVALPGEPAFLALNPMTGLLYVTITLPSQASAIAVVDTKTAAVTATIDLPSALSGTAIAVDPSSNTVYVACFNTMGNGVIAVVNGATNAISGMITGLPVKFEQYLAVDTSNHRVYAYNGSSQLAVLDGTAMSYLSTVMLPGYGVTLSAPQGLLTVDPATHTVYLLGATATGSLLTLVDGTTNMVTKQTPYTGAPVEALWDAKDNGVLLLTQNPQTAVLDGPVTFKPFNPNDTIIAISEQLEPCPGQTATYVAIMENSEFYALFDAMGKQVSYGPYIANGTFASLWVSQNNASGGAQLWGTTTVMTDGSTTTAALLKHATIPCP